METKSKVFFFANNFLGAIPTKEGTLAQFINVTVQKYTNEVEDDKTGKLWTFDKLTERLTTILSQLGIQNLYILHSRITPDSQFKDLLTKANNSFKDQAIPQVLFENIMNDISSAKYPIAQKFSKIGIAYNAKNKIESNENLFKTNVIQLLLRREEFTSPRVTTISTQSQKKYSTSEEISVTFNLDIDPIVVPVSLQGGFTYDKTITSTTSSSEKDDATLVVQKMIHIALDQLSSIQDLVSENGKPYLFLDACIPEDFFPLFEAFGTHVYYKESYGASFYETNTSSSVDDSTSKTIGANIGATQTSLSKKNENNDQFKAKKSSKDDDDSSDDDNHNENNPDGPSGSTLAIKKTKSNSKSTSDEKDVKRVLGVAKETQTNVWTVVSEDLVQATLIPISAIFKSNARLFRLAEQAIELYLQEKVQIVSLSKNIDYLLCVNDKNELFLKEEQNSSHDESVFSRNVIAGSPLVYLQHVSSRRFLYVNKSAFKKSVKLGPRQTIPHQFAQVSYDSLHGTISFIEKGQKNLILCANDKKVEASKKPNESCAFKLWRLSGVQVALRTGTTSNTEGFDPKNFSDDKNATLLFDFLSKKMNGTLWMFSLERIRHWGCKQKGYESFSKLSITAIERSLQKLIDKNAVEYFEYPDGTRLYGCSVAAQAFINANEEKSGKSERKLKEK